MDPITASLLREAGGDATWRVPPNVQAQRDAEATAIQSREQMPNGGGAVPTSAVFAQKMDPITESLLKEASGEYSPNVPVPQRSQPQPARSVMGTPETWAAAKQANKDAITNPGIGEAALTMATGALAAPIGAVAGIWRNLTGGKFGTDEGVRMANARMKDVIESLIYAPKSESAQKIVAGVANLIDESKIAGLGPTEGVSLAGASVVGKTPRGTPPNLSKQIAGKPAAEASIGAAGASVGQQAKAIVANASPELKAAVGKAGDAINLDVLRRHVMSEQLPVPVPLTKGQATQDLVAISNEMNKRGKIQEYAKLYNEQNTKLIENTNAIREQVAPDVFVRSKPETGQLVIDAYKAMDNALQNDISAKYKALTDANGGQFPIDAKAFATSAEAALKKDMKSAFLPKEFKGILQRLKSGNEPFTFGDFENMRTMLATAERSTNDGNISRALSVVRSKLEDLPMPAGMEGLKKLADEARAAARSRFQAIDADPAYKAVVNGKASADRFIDRFVVGADTANVKRMVEFLKDQPTAKQAIGAGIVDRLKESAGIVQDGGNFSQNGYNNALENLRPKLGIVFDPQNKQQIENLGEVARLTQQQPRGSWVNNSNTFTSAIAEGTANAAENAANVAAKGIPVGTWSRKLARKVAERREIKESLEPGAGIRISNMR